MSPGIQLIAGCLLLSSVVTYAWWSSIRVLFLQRDLAAIGDDFRAEMRGKGWQEDHHCEEFLDFLNRLIKAAPSFSPAVIGPIARLSRDRVRGFLGPEAEPFFTLFLSLEPGSDPDELFRAMWRVELRLFRYLAFETISGAFFQSTLLGPRDFGRSHGDQVGDFHEDEVIALLLSRGQVSPRIQPNRTA